MTNEQVRQAVDNRSEDQLRDALKDLNPSQINTILRLLRGENVKGSGSRSLLSKLVSDTGFGVGLLKGRWKPNR